jgi:hypothetical protein
MEMGVSGALNPSMMLKLGLDSWLLRILCQKVENSGLKVITSLSLWSLVLTRTGRANAGGAEELAAMKSKNQGNPPTNAFLQLYALFLVLVGGSTKLSSESSTALSSLGCMRVLLLLFIRIILAYWESLWRVSIMCSKLTSSGIMYMHC